MSDYNTPRDPRNQPPQRRPSQRRPQQMRPDQRPPRSVIVIYIIMAILILAICAVVFIVTLKKTGDTNASQSSDSSSVSDPVSSGSSGSSENSDASSGSAPEAPTSSGASEPNSSGASEPNSSGASEPNSSGSVEPNSSGAAENPPASSDGLTILGANMVYKGEDFSYSCKFTDDNRDFPDAKWECVGDSGTITDDGKFTALKSGEVTLIARDTANNLTGKLLVHVVGSADEVDFVPMVNNIPVVNKTYPLPSDYAPGGLTAETNAAFKKLVDGAAADGLNIYVVSGYRSYTKQQGTYTYWCNVYGNKEADRISARPGFSEHQLGMAIDVNSLEESFADTAEGKWLKEHCWEYGFIIRYPKEKEHLTGYAYEPWHIRYLGKDLAKKVTDSGLCLEEYLGIDSWYRG